MTHQATRPQTSETLAALYQQRERVKDRGEWWLSPKRFATDLGISGFCLQNWGKPLDPDDPRRDTGGSCPFLRKSRSIRRRLLPDGRGRVVTYYAESDRNAVRRARKARTANPVPTVPGHTYLDDACQQLQCSAKTISREAKRFGIELVHEPGMTDEDNPRGCWYTFVPNTLLNKIKQRRLGKRDRKTMTTPEVAEYLFGSKDEKAVETLKGLFIKTGKLVPLEGRRKWKGRHPETRIPTPVEQTRNGKAVSFVAMRPGYTFDRKDVVQLKRNDPYFRKVLESELDSRRWKDAKEIAQQPHLAGLEGRGIQPGSKGEAPPRLYGFLADALADAERDGETVAQVVWFKDGKNRWQNKLKWDTASLRARFASAPSEEAANAPEACHKTTQREPLEQAPPVYSVGDTTTHALLRELLQEMRNAKNDDRERFAGLAGVIDRIERRLPPGPEHAPATPTTNGTPQHHATTEKVEWHIGLDQAARLVNRTKKALRNYQGHPPTPLPPPDVPGRRGQPAEWKWSTIKPWLETVFGRNLDGINSENKPV